MLASGGEYKYRNNSIFALGKKVDKVNKLDSIDIILNEETFFFKEDAIQLNYEINTDNIIVRRLDKNQLNQIIIDKYEISNGLYKYYIDNNTNKLLLLSKEDLFNRLQSDYIYIEISFKLKVNVDIEDDNIIIINEDHDMYFDEDDDESED